MSKYATPDGKSLDYSGKVTAVPIGWRIVFSKDEDGLVHKDDMLMTYDGTFMPAGNKKVSPFNEVGASVSNKICVIRKIDEVIVVEPVIKRMKQKEFLNELNGLHRYD